MADPTYSMGEIESNGTLHIAYILSELVNDNSPIGWGKFIPIAEKAVTEAIKKKGEPNESD